MASFLRTALNARRRPIDAGDGEIDPSDLTRNAITMGDFRKLMREKMALLKLDDRFAARYVNEGFSGGEKKRLEMLQMAVLEPEFAILDETDSGLDIDALRIVAEGVNAQLNPDLGVLLITHYQRLLNYIKPDVVHVLARGRILKTGGRDLALRLEEEGYAPILREAGYEEDLAHDVPERTPRPPWPARPTEPQRATPMAIARTLDPVAIRADFPHFERDFDGRRLAYLDSAATSLKPRVVVDAVDGYLTRYTANVHRGIYTTGEEATAAYEAARATIARFINAPDRARDRLRAQRDRGHQPRRLHVGPATTSRQATRSC